LLCHAAHKIHAVAGHPAGSRRDGPHFTAVIGANMLLKISQGLKTALHSLRRKTHIGSHALS